MFRCNHTAVFSSRMLSLSHTHTQTHPSFLHKELHIFLPKISLKTHFSPYIYIYIYNFFFFCLCKFVVRALFVSVRSSERNPPLLPLLSLLLPIHEGSPWDSASCLSPNGGPRAELALGTCSRAPIQLTASSPYFGGSPACNPKGCPSPQVPPGFGHSRQASIFFYFSSPFKSPS